VARRQMKQRLRVLFGSVVTLAIAAGVFWWVIPKDNATETPPQSANSLISTNGSSLQSRTTPETPLIKLGGDAKTPAPASLATPPAPANPVVEAPTTQPVPPQSNAGAREDYLNGLKALENKELVKARQLLSDAVKKGLAPSEAIEARQRLRGLADTMIFSPARTPGDLLVGAYVVKPGDTLRIIARAHKISENLLAEVNKIKDKHFVRLNQTLKVINGPFHAVVDKSDHEMYIYLNGTYICDMRVALGSNGSTPTGKWIVRDQLENPSWADPRTGKRWRADDPDNPIGEYWIGLEGGEGDAVGQVGFGVHGTNDESSIGQDVSMGCVRLGAKDIALVYKLLLPKLSTVTIQD